MRPPNLGQRNATHTELPTAGMGGTNATTNLTTHQSTRRRQ